jgi:hypothetical protein
VRPHIRLRQGFRLRDAYGGQDGGQGGRTEVVKRGGRSGGTLFAQTLRRSIVKSALSKLPRLTRSPMLSKNPLTSIISKALKALYTAQRLESRLQTENWEHGHPACALYKQARPACAMATAWQVPVLPVGFASLLNTDSCGSPAHRLVRRSRIRGGGRRIRVGGSTLSTLSRQTPCETYFQIFSIANVQNV